MRSGDSEGSSRGGIMGGFRLLKVCWDEGAVCIVVANRPDLHDIRLDSLR